MNFSNLSKEGLLKQSAVLNVQGGGQHPLAKRPPRKTLPRMERIVVPPPLVGLVASRQEALEGPRMQGQGLATPVAARACPSLPAPSSSGDAHRPESALVAIERGDDGTCFSDRDFIDTLWIQDKPAEGSAKRRGLNPFMMERSKHLKAAKSLKNAPLNPEELQRAKDQFKDIWDSMPDKTIYTKAYNEWLATDKSESMIVTASPYRATWGGGCTSAPISSHELHEYHEAYG